MDKNSIKSAEQMADEITIPAFRVKYSGTYRAIIEKINQAQRQAVHHTLEVAAEKSEWFAANKQFYLSLKTQLLSDLGAGEEK